MTAAQTLFTPMKMGRITLGHRIIMAPLTRFRADDEHVPHEIAAEYYGQRASEGGLLITEATYISEEASGYSNVPGIWTDSQISGWKNVVEAVHSKGGYIFLQLWALGRAAEHSFLSPKGLKVVSASNIPLSGHAVPEPLSKDDILRYVDTYAQAAKNAVFGAGFDGVEIHNANGYLLDQFLQDVTNHRTDEFGGSIENRSRFSLMVVDAVCDAVGEDRVGIRFSPFNNFQEMKMDEPVPTFSYIVKEIRDRHPHFAYVHMTEPRPFNEFGRENVKANSESLDFARNIWNEGEERAFITAGGFDPELAEKVVEQNGGAVAFGRWFISNPDLRDRIRNGNAISPYDRKTFYQEKGPSGYIGYTDYSRAPDIKARA